MRRRPKRRFSDSDFRALAVGERCALCKGDKPTIQIVCEDCWENMTEGRRAIALKLLRRGLIGVALRRLYCWRFKIRMTTARLQTIPMFPEVEAA